MKSVIWSNASSVSLLHIYNYIFYERESPQNAEMVIETLIDLGNKLNILPNKFPKEPTFNDETIRFCPKWNFKIVYKIEKKRIFIINVYSTRMSFLKIN